MALNKPVLIMTAYACFAAMVSAYESPTFGSLQVFPADNAWNWDISGYQVHPNSTNFVNSVGANTSLHPDFGTEYEGAPMGIPYVCVGSGQAVVPIVYTAYGDESDPGPFPIPLTAPIEGGPSSDGDRHVIAVDTSAKILYELYRAFTVGSTWEAESGTRWDLTSNALRPAGWTSADAAGLPIFPGLIRYEETVVRKEIRHAIRMTVSASQRAYIYPATHFASSSTDPNRPPMGLRFRLKASFDISGYNETAQVILRAMKKYGMIVADNGSNWYFSGAPDDRWSDDDLNALKSLKGSDFEVVQTVDSNGDPIFPASVRFDRSRRHGIVPEMTDRTMTRYDLRGRKISSAPACGVSIVAMRLYLR